MVLPAFGTTLPSCRNIYIKPSPMVGCSVWGKSCVAIGYRPAPDLRREQRPPRR